MDALGMETGMANVNSVLPILTSKPNGYCIVASTDFLIQMLLQLVSWIEYTS